MSNPVYPAGEYLLLPDEPPGHDEGVGIVGLHPLVHHAPVQHSRDEVISGTLYTTPEINRHDE